jgi:hypothetical protein
MSKLKRIHVNQHLIRENAKNGNQEQPVFTIKTYNENIKAHYVEIEGPSRMVYSPNNPLSCGAKCWMETRASVRYLTGDRPGYINGN